MPTRCGSCGRVFPASASLARHKRWCKGAPAVVAGKAAPDEVVASAGDDVEIVEVDGAAGDGDGNGDGEVSTAAGAQLQLKRPRPASAARLVGEPDVQLLARCLACGRAFPSSLSLLRHKPWCKSATTSGAGARRQGVQESSALAPAVLVAADAEAAAAGGVGGGGDDDDDRDFEAVRARDAPAPPAALRLRCRVPPCRVAPHSSCSGRSARAARPQTRKMAKALPEDTSQLPDFVVLASGAPPLLLHLLLRATRACHPTRLPPQRHDTTPTPRADRRAPCADGATAAAAAAAGAADRA